MRFVLIIGLLLFFLGPVAIFAQASEDSVPPALPEGFKAVDFPGDKGDKIILTWKKSIDDGAGQNDLKTYFILRAPTPEGPYQVIQKLEPGIEEFKDDKIHTWVPYYYRIKVADKSGNETVSSSMISPVTAQPQWFNINKLNLLVGTLLYIGIIVAYILLARRKQDIFIRKIAGLEAVDEAIGRATEMGKPVLFVSGLATYASISTIAAFTVLGRIAKRIAEYETPLIVPCRDPIVMVIEREIVKQSYMEAGRPDAYKDEYVFFVTEDQFPYAAAVDGIMVREKPAANFFMGYFYAESLILAETGASTGAIQIAGTDALTQIPFFITACDYTLIGEELYAASAYLSREPVLLGTIKAQDLGKLILGILIIIGIIITTLGWWQFSELFKVIK
ncbi:DUF6754 domain-containing protein [Planctomycetota bacterium]